MNQNQYGVQGSSVTCIQCGYDLSGSAVGGTCPECGTAVHDSIRRSSAASGNSSSATASLVWGILGLALCGVCGIVALSYANKAKMEVARGIASPSSIGMATAGQVLGWVSVGILVLQVLMIFVMVVAS